MIWNPGTNRVHSTRDIILLKKMYHETTKQGAEIINIKPNFRKIEVEEDIDDVIGT